MNVYINVYLSQREWTVCNKTLIRLTIKVLQLCYCNWTRNSNKCQRNGL